MESTTREDAARREVRALRALYRHLALYATVLAGLAAINLIASPQRLWVLWVAAGWGVGIAAHALRTALLDRHFGERWERREIARRLERGR